MELKMVLEPKPCPREWLLGEADFEQKEYDEGTLRKAQKVTGELLWVSTKSRPDLMHTVATMTSLCLKNPVLVQRIGERALSYLYATREHSMLFEATNSTNEVHGYSDASFAPMGGRSLGCSVVVYNDTAISWRCGRQSLVALSVAEAELIEAVNAVQQSAGMAELVAELQGAKPQVTLFVDNTAAIGLCTDAAGSWKRGI